MNIFAFDMSPETSARWLDDVRKNKMILESCQLMSTAMNVLSPGHSYEVYATTHRNHPCAIWVRESWSNFNWLLAYTEQLMYQRGKPHKCGELIPAFKHYLFRCGDAFPHVYQTPFVNCAAHAGLKISYKHIPDTHSAYRLYIRDRWATDTIPLTWRHGERPFWI